MAAAGSRSRLRGLAGGLLGLAALVAAWPSLQPLWAGRPLNVLILTVESFRAEAVSPATTPFLWRAAAQGIRFEQHRAISAWTAPNVIAVLTGLTPFEQGVHSRNDYVPASWRLPLEALTERGYRTGGVQAFLNVDVYRNLGLDVEAGTEPVPWLAAQASARRPFLLWYHYLNTHLPYAPSPAFMPDWRKLLPPGDPEAEARIATVMTLPAIRHDAVHFRPEDRPAVEALYYGAVAEFDAWFRDLWGFLEASGLRRNTLVVLTADHGDEHLDRGLVGHASTTKAGHLHEELVHLPLIIWPPAVAWPAAAPPPGSVVAAPTDHLDLMPTVLAHLDQAPPRPLAGRNLLAPFGPRPWSGITSRAGFAETDPDHVDAFRAARIEWPWKLHLVWEDGAPGAAELYNLADDAGERDDLADRRPDLAAGLRGRLVADIAAMRPPTAGDGAAADAVGTREPPRWVVPAGSQRVAHADVANGFALRWTGDPAGRYVIQYRAGRGALELAGDLKVTGTVKDFGAIDRRYWDTFILPYGDFRMRVGYEGREDAWSPWLSLTAQP